MSKAFTRVNFAAQHVASRAVNAQAINAQTTPRLLHEIAAEIRKYWYPINYAAKPYVEALQGLDTINDQYGYDSAKEIVLRFLCNATLWRGEEARRIKAELKQIAGVK